MFMPNLLESEHPDIRMVTAHTLSVPRYPVKFHCTLGNKGQKCQKITFEEIYSHIMLQQTHNALQKTQHRHRRSLVQTVPIQNLLRSPPKGEYL